MSNRVHIMAFRAATPTPGHVHAANSMESMAKRDGCHHEVLVGAASDGMYRDGKPVKKRVEPKSPVPISPRLALLKKASPHVNFKATSNPFDDINAHAEAGREVHLHAEDDGPNSTYKSFQRAQHPSVGKLHPKVKLKKIKRIGDGGGISGTKVRKLISGNKKNEFDKLYDKHMPDGVHPNWKNDVWRTVRHHMLGSDARRKAEAAKKKLKESIDINSESEKDSDMDINEQFEQAIIQAPTDISQVDLQNLVAETDLEEFDLTEDDAYLLHLIAEDLEDDGTIDEDGFILNESHVLTIPQRLKRSVSMRRLSKRYSQLRKIKATRMASPDRLNMRARKAALSALRARAAGKTGKPYNSLSPQQKMAIDQALERRYGSSLSSVIAKLARTLSMMVRRKEMGRLSKARGGTNSHLTAKSQDLSEKKKPLADDDATEEEKEEGIYGDDELHNRDPDAKSTKKHRLRRRDHFSEARKSSHDANSDLAGMGSGDHIIDSLVKASKNPGFKIKWSHAEPSSIDPYYARQGIQLLGKIGHIPGMTGLSKHKITYNMSHSPKWFFKELDKVFDVKEAKEPRVKPIGSVDTVIITKSLKDIRPNKDDAAAQARQQNYATAMNPSTAAGQPGNFSEEYEIADFSADIPFEAPMTWEDFKRRMKDVKNNDV